MVDWEVLLAAEWRRLAAYAREKGSQNRGGREARAQKRRLTPAELDQAASDLLSLQRGLTGERSLVGSSYMEEAHRLGAYLLFYWFTSRAQVQGLLSMAAGSLAVSQAVPEALPHQLESLAQQNRSFFPGSSRLSILDLGSGPGPCGLAVADWFAAREHFAQGIEITACDQSRLALESTGRLATAAGYSLKVHHDWKAGADPVPEGSYHCIIMGHFLNELWKDWPDRLDKRFTFIHETTLHLAPGGILLILEPALLSAGREMLQLRDRLLKSGWQVLAPCFTQGPCPALAQEKQTCHSDFAWNPPRTVRELSQRTGLDKDLVKTTAFVLRPPLSDPIVYRDNLYRVVSEPMLNKGGRTRYLLCGREGRITFSAKLGEGHPAEGVFKTLRRSDAIRIIRPEQRETGLALGEKTEIVIVSCKNSTTLQPYP